MIANMSGKIRTPNGTSISNESQGDSPAFLQINQNGRTPRPAPITTMNKTMMSSGPPKGPKNAIGIIIFEFVCLSCRTWSARTVREREAYEKEIEKLVHRCVTRLVRILIDGFRCSKP
jgi:hypothetical protein